MITLYHYLVLAALLFAAAGGRTHVRGERDGLAVHGPLVEGHPLLAEEHVLPEVHPYPRPRLHVGEEQQVSWVGEGRRLGSAGVTLAHERRSGDREVHRVGRQVVRAGTRAVRIHAAP